jgi:hypothetical protein
MNRQLRRLIAGLLALSIATATQADVIGHSTPTARPAASPAATW